MTSRRSRRLTSARLVQPLLVLAGFPHTVLREVVDRIRDLNPTWRVAASAFPEKGRLYDNPRTILDLMLQVYSHVREERPQSATQSIPVPSRLILFYVGDVSEEALIREFGYSVLPVRLADPGREEVNRERNRRALVEGAIESINAGLILLGEPTVQELRLRLEALDPLDHLLLPPRNFQLTADLALSTWFDELLADGGRPQGTSACPGVRTLNCTRTNFGRYLGIVKKERKRYLIDHRELVFPTSAVGRHGSTYELDEPVDQRTGTLRRWLEGLFRFGTPLPDGFQHDVQWAAGRELQEEAFRCSQEGVVLVSGSHANVYPNDVVREP